jgi:hypothetical protein
MIMYPVTDDNGKIVGQMSLPFRDNNVEIPEGFDTSQTDEEAAFFEDGVFERRNIFNLATYKTKMLNNLSTVFEKAVSAGHFTSATLGIEVDCRRTTAKNDLQNVQGLISYMTRNSLTTIDYIGYSETKTGVTKANLEALCGEMEDYVLFLYQKKWGLETLINAATDKAGVDAVVW